jgi:transposase
VGYDAAKRIKGRKRHLLVDTLGLLLGVLVTPADIPEREAARVNDLGPLQNLIRL